MALGSLGDIMGGHIGNALANSNQLGQLQSYQTYSNLYRLQAPLPEGWGFTSYNAMAVPVTFLAKLRHEIKEWHGDILK